MSNLIVDEQLLSHKPAKRKLGGMLGHLILIASVSCTVSAGTNAETAANPETDLTAKQHLIKWMLSDEKFVEKAVIAGRTEVELSQLALQKSQSSQVIDFAKTMVHDHTAADSKLRDIANAQNIPLPGALDSEHRDDVDRLRNLNDAKFNAEYIDLMRKSHENAVSLFTAAAADEKLNPQLRQFAQKTLPTLRMHEEHSRALVSDATASNP